jgi:hypothetical protein
MITCETNSMLVCQQRPLNFLHLVTAHDVRDLRHALERGQLPPDFEAKLRKLASGALIHHSIAQNCRTIIALLQAAMDGSFKGACSSNCEQLLKVLAYVRKDDDAVADYRSDGFTDDQQLTYATVRELNTLLAQFKNWRLCNQVPALWHK